MTDGHTLLRDIDKARPTGEHFSDRNAAPVVTIDNPDMGFLPTMSSLTFVGRNLILRLEYRMC
jgi:hypothetical protein